jgi:hypothetical protein
VNSLSRSLFSVISLLFTFCRLPASAAPGPGFPERGLAPDLLRERFRTPPPGYGEVPFWWWTGDRLDTNRLLWQLDELHKAGVSGTQVNYAHTRSGGWKTETVEPAIFSDEWWEAFAFVARESAKRGMGVGVSGYTLDWPGRDNLFRRLGITSGELCGHVLNLRQRDVEGGTVAPQPGDRDAVSVTAYVLADGRPAPGSAVALDPRAAAWTLPAGPWRLFTVVSERKPDTLDPLNPESSRRVIERFLNPFLERTPPEARKALNYFFQDELRLAGDGRLWSGGFAERFQKMKGYDVRPKLAALFTDIGPETAKVRLDFNDVMTTLTGEHYFKPVFDWHDSRGMIYACDPASRGLNPLEFGDYFRAMRWYTAPGFDTPGSSADLVKNKVGSSIAHLYGRPRVWLEGYHSLGWQASPAVLFDSSNRNFLYGSTLLNLHGLYYSTYGGWWEWAPPCYHFRMPYWPHMKMFLKYFERLSFLLSQGDHVADAAVLYPHEPLVADPVRGARSRSLAFSLAKELVLNHQQDLDFIDADALARAEVIPAGRPLSHLRRCESARLAVAGEAYRVIVLPGMFAIRQASFDKLLAFHAAGGHVLVAGDPPEITDMASPPDVAERIHELPLFEADPTKAGAEDSATHAIRALLAPTDFSGPSGAKALHRRIGATDVYFIMDLAKPAACTFRARGTPERWDPWTGAQTPLTAFTANPDGTTTVNLDADGQPLLVVFISDAAKISNPKSEIANPKSEIPLDGNWGFTFKPTMDNRWGDFRLPAFDGLIGPEARQLTWNPGALGETALPSRMTCSFGPQFREFGPLAPGAETDALAAALVQNPESQISNPKSKIFCFSWREGAENMPAYQDWHHGLNRKVGDEFFVLGTYDRGLYDVSMPKDAPPETRLYQTFVHAPAACRAVVLATGVQPSAVWVAGQRRAPGDTVDLPAGRTSLVIRYDVFGRAAVVLRRADAPPFTQTHLLASRWHDDSAVLPFDLFGGALPQSEYTFGAPPALESAEITLRGELLSATVADRPAAVTLVRTLPSGGCLYRVTVSQAEIQNPKSEINNPVTLVVKHMPGFYGGAAFPEPVKLTCGTGRMTLGDWARVDALRCYSGGAVYTKAFTLTPEQAAGRVMLDLGNVGVTAGVAVNGREARVLVCPPWRADLSGFVKAGTNGLEVTVYNTLNNHYQTIPTRYRKPVEDAPSGLLGPVTLCVEPKE